MAVRPKTRPATRKPSKKSSAVKMPIKRANSGVNQNDVRHPLHPPKLGSKKIKLTAFEVYKSCNPTRIKASKDIAIRRVTKRPITKFSFLPPETIAYRFIMYSKLQKHDHRTTIFCPEGSFRPRGPILHDCDCVAEGTLILTSEGWKPVETLTSTDQNKKFEYNIDGVLYKGSPAWHVGQKAVYRITLNNGMSIETTLDHKFLQMTKKIIKSKDRYECGQKKKIACYGKKWTKAENLNIGDSLIINADVYDKKIVRSETFYEGYVCGFFLGEGSYFNTGRPIIEFVSRQDRILEILKKAGVGLNAKISNHSTRIFGDQRLLGILRKYGIHRENRHTFFPAEACGKSDEYFFGFLSGIIDAEASIDKGQTNIYCGEHIVKQLQLACIARGIKSHVRLAGKKGAETNFGARTRDVWKLCIPNFDVYLVRHNLEIAHGWYHRGQEFQSEYNHDKIMSIEYVSQKHVYDISVPGVTRFVANGFVVHNCADHMYRYEYAMAKRYGTAFIYRCNGEFPVETNPGLKPGICKHVRLALKHLLTSYKEGTLNKIKTSTKISLNTGK